jgi:hypothetical protein
MGRTRQLLRLPMNFEYKNYRIALKRFSDGDVVIRFGCSSDEQRELADHNCGDVSEPKAVELAKAIIDAEEAAQ